MTDNTCYTCDEMVVSQALLEHAVEDMCETAFTRLIDCGIISQEQYYKLKDEYERNNSNRYSYRRTYSRGS